MRVGLIVTNFAPPGGMAHLGTELAPMARAADAAGFDSFWVWDHFFQLGPVGPGVTDRPMLEGYTTLGYVAGVTDRIRLGTMVTGVTYRHPGILIKEVTTLDVLSGGRAWFGIGAAWFEEEHNSLGIYFPPLKERFEWLEETLQIAHQMWTDQGKFDAAKPYEGKHFHLARTLNVPQSLQRPHPPILVGGSGEQKTLRMVAQYADACNLFWGLGKDELQRKLDVLRGHCQRLGRPYADIEKTVNVQMFVTPDGRNDTRTPQQAIATFREMAELGFDMGIANLRNLYEPGAFDVWAREIIPAVAQIPVAGR